MGVSTSVEEWLTRVLDGWRVASGDAAIEPLDTATPAGESSERWATSFPAMRCSA